MSAQGWDEGLHPAHCGNCHAAFRVPASAGAPVCPNCLAARLEPIPALERDAPPELILPFHVAEATLNANLERWLRDIPFRPASLRLAALRRRLMPIFIPMYLADASVWGAWSGQMGFDYLVASSEERYNGGQWVTQRLNETRTRWEPRAGDISRKYENIAAPALENHTALMSALGEDSALPFDTSRAVPFSSDAMGGALVRAPEIATANAWKSAQLELGRRAASDCQTAANAQHHEQFNLRAAFGEPHWTLMLLPMYVTSYTGDDRKWIPVRVNGQTGFVSGVKRASMKRAQSWSLLLGAAGLVAFLLCGFIALTLQSVPGLLTAAGILLALALVLCLAAPVPVIVAWQFNRAVVRESV